MQRDDGMRPAEYVRKLKAKLAAGHRLSRKEQDIVDTYDSLFSTPAPANNAEGLGPDTEDDLGTLLRLKLSEVKPYDRNPRIDENEQFSNIKSWLREVRRPLVLAVTRRPGESLYMPAEGGNTRLRALHELYDETGDDAYRWILAHYVPWPGEAALLIAHMGENTQRDGLSFWDLSKGLALTRSELERGAGKVLSLRHLEQELARKGLKVVPSTLSAHLFAASRLEALGAAARTLNLNDVRRTLQPALNNLLDVGRRFEHTDDALWRAVITPALERERERFELAMSEAGDSDTPPGVNTEHLISHARRNLGQLLGVEPPALDKMLRLAADHPNLAREELLRACAPTAARKVEAKLEAPVGEPAEPNPQPLRITGLTPTPATAELLVPAAPLSESGSGTLPPPARQAQEADRAQGSFPAKDSTSPAVVPTARLRAQAASLAAQFGLEALVHAQDDLPLGFWVEPLDPAAAAHAAPGAGGLSAGAVWWLLVSVTGQLLPDISDRLPAHALWRQMLAVADDVDRERVIEALRESAGLEWPMFGVIGALLGDERGGQVLHLLAAAREHWGAQASRLVDQRLVFWGEAQTQTGP